LDRRRCAPLAGGPLEHPRATADGGVGHRVRAADADPTRHRGARLRRRGHARPRSRGGRRVRAADAAGADARLLPPGAARVRGAHVLDPRGDLDEPHDILIRGGQIAELGAAGSLSAPEDGELFDATGKHAFPGFVDPHVHLRTPGQEYKEDLESGTAAAAAGGFCAVVAMPNTVPAVDDAAVLRSLTDTARSAARVPVGFLASITRRLEGDELTE